MSEENKYVQTLNNLNYSEDSFKENQEYDILHNNDDKICHKHETFSFEAVNSCQIKKVRKKKSKSKK